jgi:hypothetical protein
MQKHIPLIILLLTPFCYNCEAQSEREQVYLHLDKYQCWSGDSIYFRGYINYRGFRSTLSTNLYVDLWTENGVLQYRGLFPIVDGLGIGNFKVPDSLGTENYVLRAFTLQQTNFDTSNLFTVPIAVYNKDKPSKPVLKSRYQPVNHVTYSSLQYLRMNVTKYRDSLAVFLDMDTDCVARNFTVIHPFAVDSGEFGNVTLTPNHSSRYSIFKIDTSKEIETILIKEDSNFISKSYVNLKGLKRDNLIKINADTFDISTDGYNSWEFNLPDTLQWISSVSVTPADRSMSPPVNIYSLKDTRTENLLVPIKQLDTSLITFTGKVMKRYSNKLIKDPFSRILSVTGIKDTTYVFIRNIDQDDHGNFRLDSLLFYGKIRMQFRLNKMEDGSNDNVRLELKRYIPPQFDTSAYQQTWSDDSTKLSVDTVYTEDETHKYDLMKVKTLKTVIVKHFKSPREELDKRYTSGPLMEPLQLSFDIRTETRYSNISDFLRQNFGMDFQGGFSSSDTPKDHNGEPVMFYLDGNLQPWWMIYDVDFKRLAYVKGGTLTGFQETPFERFQMGKDVASRFSYDTGGNSGGLGVPVSHDPYLIGIYTRKDKDWRTMPSDVNSVEVKGYEELTRFTRDRLTLFWDPIVVGNKFRIRFNNNQDTRSFRVVVEGINQRGQVIHREQILD